MTKKPKNHGKVWTVWDLAIANCSFDNHSVIAKRLGRTTKAVKRVRYRCARDTIMSFLGIS